MIARKLVEDHYCDRCGAVKTVEKNLPTIFYGDPQITIDVWRAPDLMACLQLGWGEFFGYHFCDACSKVVKEIFIEARTKAQVKPELAK